MLNKYIVDIISPEDIPRASQQLEDLNSGKSIISEWNLKCKNQSTIIVELSAKKLPDNCILGMVRDITERKKEEENMKSLQNALEYDKLKTEFFSNISHELRTPINVIMSALQMCDILNKNNSLIDNLDRVNRYFGIMKQNCYRLIKLVNNLIDITRIDSGYLQLELNNYNIISIIEDITLSVADYIENKGLSLIFDTDAEEVIMACDPDKIERIVLNILSNAVKFTEPGGRITVKVKKQKGAVIISIKDTGAGIPEDKQELIFERFVQVDKSLSRKNEGSGIGLSLVKSLIEMHNGDIHLNSKPNEGSEFIIKLPVNVLDQSPDNSINKSYIQQSNTERIHIEFSDIYS
jgi:signal transduction histidine kinase